MIRTLRIVRNKRRPGLRPSVRPLATHEEAKVREFSENWRVRSRDGPSVEQGPQLVARHLSAISPVDHSSPPAYCGPRCTLDTGSYEDHAGIGSPYRAAGSC